MQNELGRGRVVRKERVDERHFVHFAARAEARLAGRFAGQLEPERACQDQHRGALGARIVMRARGAAYDDAALSRNACGEGAQRGLVGRALGVRVDGARGSVRHERVGFAFPCRERLAHERRFERLAKARIDMYRARLWRARGVHGLRGDAHDRAHGRGLGAGRAQLGRKAHVRAVELRLVHGLERAGVLQLPRAIRGDDH